MPENHCPLNLFIIKKFHGYYTPSPISNGLRNSAQFIVDMLLAEGWRAKLVVAIDGNSIDKLVAENHPSRVVIEAIWVTPAKMKELVNLHPSVQWTIRVHSEIPFLANEGMSIEWLAEFEKMGIEIAFNSEQTVKDFSVIGESTWLPNYYPVRKPRPQKPECDHLDIGCFGAIRPLKNQLIQAFGAVKYAQRKKKKLIFHMNGSRLEQNGENNLKNIKALLAATGNELVLHPWMDHVDFLELIAEMDICLQVSLSESFCIVASDAVSMGVPLVGSEAIRWLPERAQADVNSAESIADAMRRADTVTVWMNHHALKDYIHETVKAWNQWIEK